MMQNGQHRNDESDHDADISAPLAQGLDYQIIFNATSNGMAFTEIDSGAIIDVNAAWIRSFGITRAQCIGKTALDLGLWTNQAERLACLAALQKNGHVKDFEANLMLQSGAAPHLISAEIFTMSGKRYLLWEFRDITEKEHMFAKINADEVQIKSLLATSEQSRRILLGILEDEKRAKDALRESETNFRTLFENSRDAIGVSKKGVNVFANPAYLQLFGYASNEEFSGTLVIDNIAPSHHQQIIQNIELRAMDDAVPTFYETRGKKKNGIEFDFEVNVSTYTLHNETYTLANLRDITERKQAEAALRESEERFRTFIEQSVDGVMLLDESSILREWNQANEAMTGLPRQDVVGRPWIDVMQMLLVPERRTPERLSTLQSMSQSMVTSGIMPLGKRMYEAEIQVRDGRRIIIQQTVFTISTPKGNRIGSISRDITALKQAENALRESEEKYRKLVDSANEAILVAQDGMLKFVNRKAIDLIGYPEQELLARPYLDFIHADDHAMILATYTHRAEGVSVPANNEFRVLSATGAAIWAEVNTVMIDWQGKPATLNFLTDITTRKQAEQQIAQSLREKETLIRELYHRTKNTLQIIRGIIMLQAAEFTANSDVQKLVQNTEQRIQAISLVHQMLYKTQDLSQISIRAYIQELSTLILQSFAVSQDRITVDIAIDDQYFLLDTAIPFGFILNELMTNSLKYAFPNGAQGVISIALTRSEDEKNTLRYADNGVGVPAGFDFRNQNSLGLKLIYSIGEQQMMGKVDMKNDRGVSCNFEFHNNLYKARV